ncbi:asparagine synthase-related protein [Methylomonas fluvii]|uniref:asparagine synthase (glutamine-hydrolyzing) n=1 Tax=Methylomonas fluvii TaxID=1854564 RepID=A0ABR9DI07_9GAMM|nr:asparagine synthase-related protein [Methylomonas fluvii]MBD9362441.1 hypothetical protein [Methylomonas fluvii]
MRLICGFHHFDGRPAEPERLETMVAAMIEPGLQPQVAYRVQGSLALAVLDFAAQQPFEIACGDNGMLLADDCRLDEPAELARMLGVSSNDNLLLTMLLQRGEAGLPELLGDFAFAVWDPLSQSLLCVRDAMGIRPLFVTKKQGPDFAFASLPRALHAGGFATRRLDETQFARDLLNSYPEPERTLFEDIARLAPGHSLRISSQGRCEQVYWKLEPGLAGSHTCTSQSAAEALRVEIERAVRCRLPAQGPVAAHLSGGLDSSAISILAARMLRSEGRPLLAYSFLSSHPDAEDERPFVESVLRQEPDIDWTPLTVEDWPAFFLPQMDCDQLLPNDTRNLDIRVCADAAGRGAQMLLSGWGGDEGATFNGRGALAEALLHGQWPYLANEFRAFQHTRGLSLYALLKSEVISYIVPHELKRLKSRLRKDKRHVPSCLAALLQAEFSGEWHENIILGPNAALNRWRLLGSPHLSRRAEKWALMGARQGLAVGFPMLDRRVVELAVSLPSKLFQREGRRRRIFRDAMAGVLPDKIRWRDQKIIPVEEIFAMLAAQRNRLLPVLDNLHAHPVVTHFLDMDKIKNMLASDFSEAQALAVMRSIHAAAYLKQHY